MYGGAIVYSTNSLLKYVFYCCFLVFTIRDSAEVKRLVVHMSFHIATSLSLALISRSKIAELKDGCVYVLLLGTYC